MILKPPFLLENLLGDVLLPGAQFDLLIAVIQLLQTVVFTSLLILVAWIGLGVIIKLIKGD